MKTYTVCLAVCLILCCASLGHSKHDRALKNSISVSATASCKAINGKCRSESKVTGKAINDAAKSLSESLDEAIAVAEKDGDAEAAANAFAQAIAQAYAIIMSSHYLSTFATPGSYACATTSVHGEASATAIATAIATAFAKSKNEVASAAADCAADVVSKASVTAVQKANFKSCTFYGREVIYVKLVTVGFVEAVATAYATVFTAVKNKTPEGVADCDAYGDSSRTVTTTETPVEPYRGR